MNVFDTHFDKYDRTTLLGVLFFHNCHPSIVAVITLIINAKKGKLCSEAFTFEWKKLYTCTLSIFLPLCFSREYESMFVGKYTPTALEKREMFQVASDVLRTKESVLATADPDAPGIKSYTRSFMVKIEVM